MSLSHRLQTLTNDYKIKPNSITNCIRRSLNGCRRCLNCCRRCLNGCRRCLNCCLRCLYGCSRSLNRCMRYHFPVHHGSDIEWSTSTTPSKSDTVGVWRTSSTAASTTVPVDRITGVCVVNDNVDYHGNKEENSY